MAGEKQQMHFVLVHGAGMGAWCWFKLQTLLEAAGHRVTALDLSASGINLKRMDELRTFSDYNQPLMDLMESISPGEKVILVGHSLGGMSIGFAMEKYHHKISVAVFAASTVPKTGQRPSYISEKILEMTPEGWFGPDFVPGMFSKCPPQDLTLANSVMRPSFFFEEDLARQGPFSAEGYGSVERACIISGEDKAILPDLQRWLAEDIKPTMVKEIKDADHMLMLSRPQQLYQLLLEIVN